MDTTVNCSPVIVANGDYPVRCTEEVLLPFFTDESLQVAMDSQQPPALPELRLVLLGRKGVGKSAAGNTVLGGAGGFESGKPTEECVKRRADAAGRKVTVVDTPGWEWYYPLNSTPNWVRRETLRSVSLCPPGPHAVLLVVRSCASVTEEYISAIEDHLEPLGKGVWEHIMLLFTRGDELGLISMEQRILMSGPALQRLLQKCGNRYHVVDNRSKGDGKQVKELIRKLEEMVKGKKDGSSHFEMDNKVLLGLEADGKRRASKRRKKQRQMEEQVQRGTIKAALINDGLQASELDAHHSFSKAPRRLLEVRLVLLGERETGKSSAGNTILGKACFFQPGAVTEECIRQQAEVAAKLVTVVDTPGWEGGAAGATPERVKREIVSSVALCPPGPHALLLTLRVDTVVRAGHVREHLELLGEGVWRHMILVFTHGDQLREGVDIEQHIQGGGKELQWLLEKCRGRYHVVSSVDGAGRGNGGSSKVTELLQKVEKMATMNRCEAFSSLVQEVRDLSQQRNEKFNQRLKEMGDKMLRQEAELKNMREREMKSIRWFFDRKKKGKSPGKVDVQREEEEDEDRRVDERKNDIGELEERMRWLTEDKERETQDLSIENERIRIALNQSGREQERTTLKLELKERELEELKERIDEQQLKILDLERASVENEHERKQREEAIKAKKQEWMSEVDKLEGNIELEKKDKAELMEKIDSLKTEMDETKRHYEKVLERKTQEKNTEMAEMEERLKAEMEKKLLEKDDEQEELRRIAENIKQHEKQMDSIVEEMKTQHKKEIERNIHEKETEIQGIKLQHQEEMARKNNEIEKHQEEIRDIKQERQREVKELERQLAEETEKQLQERQREIREIDQRHAAQIEERLLQNKKEKKLMNETHEKYILQKMQEGDRLIEELKCQHINELKEKMRESDKEKERLVMDLKKEMEQRLEEKEKEVEERKLKVEDKVDKIEIDYLNYKKDMEQTLEEREREIEVIKGHLKGLEQQMEEERERDQLYKKHMGQKLEEKGKIIEKLNEHLKDIDDIMQRKEEIILDQKIEAERWLQDREQKMEEMKRQLLTGMETKLKEKETEIERLKQQADSRETSWRKKDEKAEKEMNRLIEIIEEKTKERAQAQCLLAERDSEFDEAKKTCAAHFNEMEELKESIKEQTEIWQHHTELERKKHAEKDEELDRLRQRDRENDKEIVQLRLTIEQTKSELKELTSKMEKEMTSMIQEYEKEIVRMNENIESVTKEKDCAISRLEQEGRQSISDVTEKYEQSLRRVEELQEQNAKTRKEVDHLKLECEELKKESEEVREHLTRHERQVESKEEEIQSILRERDVEVGLLKEANVTLQVDLERMKEQESEVERQMNEMREAFQKQLKEKQCELRMKEDKPEEEFLKREREQVLSRNEEALSKRGHELDAKEEELVEKEVKLGSKEEELSEWEANLEKQQKEKDKSEQDLSTRAKTIEKKERELESLLRALEGKQRELNCHGQDLQRKVKGLKNQGKELKDREHHLRNEEQDLLNWKSELQMRNEHVNTTTQQLDEMGRNLALLKDELHNKDENLKASFKKLSNWEQNLKEREDSLQRGQKRELDNGRYEVDDNVRVHERDLFNLTAAAGSSEDDLHLMYREVSERREKGRGRESDRGENMEEDQRVKTAPSAAESNNCHLETLPEMEMVEEEEGMRGRGLEMRKKKGREDLERAEVIEDVQFLSASQSHRSSNNKEPPESDLRVVVLGESWSSRSPAGATFLCGEASKPSGTTFRPWRGQIAGRRLAVAEPLGLRWRDGPDPTNAMQSRGILDGISWCHPGPHVVLLLMPTFLTCTQKYRRAAEEHMSLLGEEIWQRTLVLFTWGEILGESAEQHILRNGELTGLVERCGGRYHVLSSKKSTSMIEGLFEKMEDMVALNSGKKVLDIEL